MIEGRVCYNSLSNNNSGGIQTAMYHVADVCIQATEICARVVDHPKGNNGTVRKILIIERKKMRQICN